MGSFSKEKYAFSKGNWFEEKFDQKKVNFWSKVFILSVCIIWICIASVPYLKDVFPLINNGEPNEMIAKVTNVRPGVGAMSVKLTLDKTPNYLSAYYFPRKTFEQGSTYKLWYLPHTGEVLKAELVSAEKI